MLTAFNKLKTDMQLNIELSYHDYSDTANKLQLWVDVSAYGSGAYLTQRQGDSNRVIGFASMTFTPTLLNYSTLERELTALRRGIKNISYFPVWCSIYFVYRSSTLGSPAYHENCMLPAGTHCG